MLPSNVEYKILITHLWQHVQCELGRDLLKPAYQNTVQKLNDVTERLRWPLHSS